MKTSFLYLPSFLQDYLAIVRIIAGILIMKHGIVLFSASQMDAASPAFAAMGMPMPAVMAHLAKSVEFFGGILFASGFLTHSISAILTLNMLIALAVGHGLNIFEGEMACLYMSVFAAFAITGGGRYSIDRLVFKR